MNLLDLQGKVAVVTGGAKGIGAASVKLFQEAGAVKRTWSPAALT